jgi:hypothetical protein
MKYLIPFVYGLSTRTKTIFYKISFLAIIVFPILFVVIFYNNDLMYVLPRFTLAFISMYCVYEIGYIFNDTYTVKYEDNPTHRLNEKERLIVERLANILISIRTFIVIICCIILNYIEVQNLTLFIIMLGLLDVSYALHNFFRSATNILTIFLVLVFKYCSIPILFMPLNNYVLYFVILMFAVPVIRTIEFAAKPNYKIKLFEKYKYDTFRIYYYGVFTILAQFLKTFGNARFLCMFILFAYLFTFRFVCFLAIKSEKIKEARKYNTRI